MWNATHFTAEIQRVPSRPDALARVVLHRELRDDRFARRATKEGHAMDAKIADAATHEFDVKDIEYLRHGDNPLQARVYTPRGEGPFPALVEAHGGAWCMSDRMTERVRHEAMASRGIVSVALDFRSGNEDPYPASVADINYAIRWVKLNARELKTSPDLVGVSGQSSGGHLVMLNAMRPRDPRYAAIQLPAGSPAHDASVRCVIMSWPVINPLSRFRIGKQLLHGVNPPEWPKTLLPRQESYWRTEANMGEGSPLLILERGEKVLTPPAIWFQGKGDALHDYKDPDSNFPDNEPQRFVDRYRKAGGDIDLVYFDGPRHEGHTPDLSKMQDNFAKMAVFVGKHMKR
jgi:acetyl esterase